MYVRAVFKDTNIETSAYSSALSQRCVDNKVRNIHVCGEVCTSVDMSSQITTRLTSVESPDRRLFADGGFKRDIDGTEMAGWGVAIVSPENLVRIICGPVVCDLRLPAFLGATSCGNNTAELCALRLFAGLILSFSAALVYAFCLTPNTRPVSLLVLPTLKRTPPWPVTVMSSYYGGSVTFTSLPTMFMATRETRAMSVLTLPLLLA